jgi:hypothetical protein
VTLVIFALPTSPDIPVLSVSRHDREEVIVKRRIVDGIICATLLLSVASAQQAQPASTTADSSSIASTDSAATVFVYRYKQFVGSALSPSVYCDESELARMENGRFFVAKLAPGKHVFRSNDKQAGIDVDLKPGQQYYIRVELATGFMKGHGRLVSVAPEQGSYEIKNLKPIDTDKIKDTQHVTALNVAAN